MTPSEREEIEKVATEVIDYASLFSDGEAQHANLKKGIINAILTQVEKARAEERERCAKIVEDHLIYTGPGGVDPEPIQKILSDAIRNKLNQQGE